jgi:uncharacterized protein YegJ (DUF2314 family)
MVPRLILLLIVVGAAGCVSRPSPESPQSLPRANTSATSTRADDPELDEAIARARGTLDTFIARLLAPQRGEVFSVEAAFPAVDGSKLHLWIGDVSYKNGAFQGTVTTKPLKPSAIAFGQRTTIPRAEITDWMILKNGKSEGGFTIELLLARQGQPR